MKKIDINKNREKWLAALRSGEYKQTTLTMKRDGAYCALGVLREVALPWWKKIIFSELSWKEAAQLAGLNDTTSSSVLTWNDNRRLPFPIIADKLETTWAAEALEEEQASKQPPGYD